MPTTVLIIVDGLRPDALDLTRYPHINGLHACGASTLRAASVMPNITFPATGPYFTAFSLPDMASPPTIGSRWHGRILAKILGLYPRLE